MQPLIIMSQFKNALGMKLFSVTAVGHFKLKSKQANKETST